MFGCIHLANSSGSGKLLVGRFQTTISQVGMRVLRLSIFYKMSFSSLYITRDFLICLSY